MKSMVEYVHDRIKEYDFNIAVDFTLGNGHDTQFLDQLNKEVYSFDIQQIAVDNMKNQVSSRVHLICDNHANFKQYVDTFDIGIFNLGYLPNGNHTITTMLETTQVAIVEALQHMTTALFIVVYIGHDEGKKESIWINDYVSSLDNHYNVSAYQMMNKKNSPYVIEVEKRKKNKYE